MVAALTLDGAAAPPHAELEHEIARLKRELNAVILAHYYQDDEIQDIADFVGDSLDLSRRAASTDADVIVFCGVHFMAETASILNPYKLVLLPDLDAGCSLADRCPAEAFERWLRGLPGRTAVTYINSSAAVKAMSDVICTSTNAAHIVAQLPADAKIAFAPDRHLGRWVLAQTGREMDLWPGFCVVHEQFSERRLIALRERLPHARVVAHPECEAGVLAHADFVGSTGAMLRHVRESPSRAFIVATEAGILHQMHKARPDAEFIPAEPNSGCSCALCPYMRLNTLEKVWRCLRERAPSVEVEPAVAARARVAVERMLEMSAGV